MRKSLLSLTLILILQTLVYACWCPQSPQELCHYASQSDVVVIARINDTLFTYGQQPFGQPNFVEVIVLQTINGTVSSDTIYIEGEGRTDCGADLRNFSINDSILFLLTSPRNNDTFYLDVCEYNYMHISGDTLIGNFTDSIQNLTVDSFINFYSECASYSSPVSVAQIEAIGNTIQCYPNPSREILNIQIPKSLTHEYFIELFDVLGQVVFSKVAEKNDSPTQIQLSDLPKGIFVIHVSSNGRIEYASQIVKE